METWEPPQGWRAWTEELDLLQWAPRPVFARPDNLGSLGHESYLIEPFTIDLPERVHLGDKVVVGERSSLTVDGNPLTERHPEIRIGNGVQIGSDAVIECPAGLEIGSGVGLSVRVTIGGEVLTQNDAGPVRIGDEVVIGAGATIQCGVSIGRRAYVGAGAVVTRDVPPLSVVFGDPARIIRRWDEDVGKWMVGG